MDYGIATTTALCFAAGLLSFLSPCVLPLLPSYISYITGISFEELTRSADRSRLRRTTILSSLMFVLGFSVVFISLGASATAVGKLLGNHVDTLRKVGGVFIILLGLSMAGLFKLTFLSQEKRFSLGDKPKGLFGSAIVGVAFAAGWTPCIGPILASVLVYASTYNTVGKGIFLLAVYSLGLGLPFFLTSLAINAFLLYFRHISRYIRFVQFCSGLLLISMGILLYSDYFSLLSGYIPQWIEIEGL